MTRRAQLADGTVLEFPDNTPDAVIDRVVKQHVTGNAQHDDSALGGFIAGALKPLDNLTQAAMHLPGMGLIDQAGQAMGLPSAQQAIQGNQQARANNTRTGYQTLGNIAGTLPTLALPGGTLTQGAASGALLSDAKSPYSLAGDAALGAIGGKAGEMVGNAFSYLAKPVVSRAAQALHDAGVDLTPGQLARSGKGIISNAVSGIEDRLAGFPLVGDVIQQARGRGITQLNHAVANDALAPIGERVPKDIEAGHDLIDYVQNKLSQRYQQVVPNLVGHIDQQFGQDLADAAQATNVLPNTRQRQFETIVRDVFTNRMENNGSTIAGQNLKDAESRLTKLAGDYSKSTDADQRILGDSLFKVRQALRDMAARSDPSGTELQAVNQGWAKLKQYENASNVQGVAMPTALARQANKTGYGTDLARSAQQLLPSTVPDSGTAGRAALGNALLDAPAVMAAFGHPGMAVPMASSLLYTKPGMQALNAFIFRKGLTSQPLANAFSGAGKLAPAVVPALLRARPQP